MDCLVKCIYVSRWYCGKGPSGYHQTGTSQSVIVISRTRAIIKEPCFFMDHLYRSNKELYIFIISLPMYHHNHDDTTLHYHVIWAVMSVRKQNWCCQNFRVPWFDMFEANAKSNLSKSTTVETVSTVKLLLLHVVTHQSLSASRRGYFLRCFKQWTQLCNNMLSIYRCADSVVQVKSCLGLFLVVSNGSLELLQAGQFGGGLRELIPKLHVAFLIAAS